MIGFDGHRVSKELKEIVLHYCIGGIILFSRNIEDPVQLANLCNDLQVLSPDIPLFISIDQEGGRVSRLKEPFTQLPPARFFGRSLERERDTGAESPRERRRIVEIVNNLGRIIARELRSVGINMNLAPVLDTNTNPNNPVIGDRSFGSDPCMVSTLGNAFMEGLRENGVIATGKHFPGHGDTDCDSHKQLPVVQHDVERLERIELRPFIEAIGIGLETIMTAHILYPAWDPLMPATLSERIVKELLRKTIGFEGLILSDDMEMDAIARNYSIEKATVNAVKAGVDVIIIGSDLEKQEGAVQSVLKAVDEGVLSETRIEESVERIKRLKNKYLLPYRPTNCNDVGTIIGCREHREVADEINLA